MHKERTMGRVIFVCVEICIRVGVGLDLGQDRTRMALCTSFAGEHKLQDGVSGMCACKYGAHGRAHGRVQEQAAHFDSCP